MFHRSVAVSSHVKCCVSTGCLLGILQLSCSHVCCQLCVSLGQTKLTICLFSPGLVVLNFEGVPPSSSHFSWHKQRSCSFAHYLRHALLVFRLHHSALEIYLVRIFRPDSHQGLHQSLDAVGCPRLLGRFEFVSSACAI